MDELPDPGAPAPPADPPKIAVVQLAKNWSAAIESTGWLRYLLERVWHIPYTNVRASTVGNGKLDGYDVVLLPNGPSDVALDNLGDDGQQALQDWVNGGGHLISWRGGTEVAAELGLTTAELSDPTSDIPGSLLRVRLDPDSPLHSGVGDEAYAFYEYDDVMRASSPDDVAVSFPPADSSDWFISGFADGAEELGGTAAVVDEPVGNGRATVFSVDPNYRAFTTGFQEILRNALLGDPLSERGAPAAGSAARAPLEDRARLAAERLIGSADAIRLSVRPESEAGARSVLDGFGASYQIQRSPGRVGFVIANPGGLTADEHPFARQLPAALEDAGVATIALRMP